MLRVSIVMMWLVLVAAMSGCFPSIPDDAPDMAAPIPTVCKNGVWMSTPPLLVPASAPELQEYFDNPHRWAAQPELLAVANSGGDGGVGSGEFYIVSANGKTQQQSMVTSKERASITLFSLDHDHAASFKSPNAVVLDADITVKSITTADFTHDGQIDVAATLSSGAVAVFQGNGFGGLSPRSSNFIGMGAGAIAPIDCDGDGMPNALVGGPTNFIWWLHNGKGIVLGTAFSAAANLHGKPIAIATSAEDGRGGGIPFDLENDGAPDAVAAVDPGMGQMAYVEVLTGQKGMAACTFKSLGYPIGGTPQALAVADVTGDGAVDLILANLGTSPSLTILKNDGRGAFSEATNEGLPSLGQLDSNNQISIAIIDLNGDGHLDVVTANKRDSSETSFRRLDTASVFFNNMNPNNPFSKSPSANYYVGPNPTAVVNLGLQGPTGAPELAFATSGGIGLILAGVGPEIGTLHAPQVYRTSRSNLSDVEIGDVDGDGKLDVVAVSSDGMIGSIDIFLGDGLGTLRADGAKKTDLRWNVGVVAKSDAVVPNASLADLDDDKRLDVLLTGWDPGSNQSKLVWRLNKTSKGEPVDFGNEKSIPLGSELNGLAVGTFEKFAGKKLAAIVRDRDPDDSSPGKTGALFAVRFDSSGTPMPAAPWLVQYPFGLAVGDVTGDAYSEVVLFNQEPKPAGDMLGFTNMFRVLELDDSGNFATRSSMAAPDHAPSSVCLADMRKDRFSDVVGGDSAYDQVSMIPNASGGQFGDAIKISTDPAMPGSVVPMGSKAVGARDLDGDGLPDVVAVGDFAGPPWIAAAMNKGENNYTRPVRYLAGPDLRSMVLGDLNGDGRNDVVVGSYTYGFFTVLLSECAP